VHRLDRRAETCGRVPGAPGTPRLLSAAIAAWAVAFNWLTHPHRLQGGFLAVMSALGYAVWLIHTGNQRRDRLRAAGDLPPVAPAYESFSHWLRRPRLTLLARRLAKGDPGLGLYGSRCGPKTRSVANTSNTPSRPFSATKIRTTVDRDTAEIVIAVYDLDQIAARPAANADYDTLTTMISDDLTPARLIRRAADGRAADAPEPYPARDSNPSTRMPTRRSAPVPATARQPKAAPAASDNQQRTAAYQPTSHEDAVM
jgi:hypothetical protein